ncbi:MAG: flavin reductase family protein [candidate division WOR-3 bacterium]
MKLRYDMLTHGVNIVCTKYEGKFSGLAVAWATQIDVDRILICVGSQSYTRELILKSKIFGLSVLAKGQEEIARKFGRQSSKKVDKFKNIAYHTLKTGSPLLNDCIAVFDCEVEKVFDYNDTKLIVGKIVAAEFIRKEYEPLVYKEKDY